MIEIGPQEKVIRIVRRHWFVLLTQIFFYFIFLLLPFILLVVALNLPVASVFELTGSLFLLGGFIAFLWLYLLWNAIFLTLTDYYLDALIITDRRIFQIDQHGLFRRESTTFRIDRIQDVTVDVKGVIATFLNFGDIHIHTAGEGKDFIGRTMEDPYGVKKQINEAIDHWNEDARNVTLAETSPLPHNTSVNSPNA